LDHPARRGIAEIDAEADVAQEGSLDQRRLRCLIVAEDAVRHRRIDMPENIARAGDRQNLRQQGAWFGPSRIVDLSAHSVEGSSNLLNRTT